MWLPHSKADPKRYLRLILSSKVYDVIEITPLTTADMLSDQLGCNILLKREDLLPGSSYKLRGVYNRMAHLHANERWRGVVTYSTGKLRHPFKVLPTAKSITDPERVQGTRR